jgi:hypothetical protein
MEKQIMPLNKFIMTYKVHEKDKNTLDLKAKKKTFRKGKRIITM